MQLIVTKGEEEYNLELPDNVSISLGFQLTDPNSPSICPGLDIYIFCLCVQGGCHPDEGRVVLCLWGASWTPETDLSGELIFKVR